MTSSILLLLLFYPVMPSKNTPVQRVRTREQRAEMRQKKYRYFYQVRTAHGDVISQVLLSLFTTIT